MNSEFTPSGNYREIIRKEIEYRKQLDSSFTFKQFAKNIRIPPSYLSRVFSEDADFNSDQLFQACEYLEFSAEKTEYLHLLLEKEKSTLKKRRELINQKIRQLQNEQAEIAHHLKATRVVTEDPSRQMVQYYLNPINQLVHIALDIPRYQKEVYRLKDALHLTSHQIEQAIHYLEAIHFIKRTGSEIELIERSMHLKRTSEYYPVWRNLVRSLSLGKLQTLKETENTSSFSAFFSASPSTQKKIQKLFLEFISQTESLVERASSEEVYQMNFDLFPWTSSSSEPS